MNKSILLLVAAGSLVLPAMTHADPAGKTSPVHRTVVTSAPAKPDPNRVIYYIGTVPSTGSNIPVVRRAYQGRIDCASSPAVYGLTRLQEAGQLDVGATLQKLEPSIGVR